MKFNKPLSIRSFLSVLIPVAFAVAAVAEQGGDTKTEQQYRLSAETQAELLAEMVWVEGGSFTMGYDGDDAADRERPAHTVTVDGFYIGRTELSQDIFEELMGWNSSYFPCAGCPVNNLSWFNIQLLVERLNKTTGKRFRLPTEAEWEYAARGGNRSKGFLFSGSNTIDEVAWHVGNAANRSHPVAQKAPNELGLYDMTGNLWEFCLDDMNPHSYALHHKLNGDQPRINPLNLPNEDDDPRRKAMKVLRGGGYEFGAQESQVYRRDGASNNVRMPDIGFRLVMEGQDSESQF
ncbi:MAG: SUMF1/EgtB/PvdO family nonheme iron enzyme [Halioglobus sp.]